MKTETRIEVLETHTDELGHLNHVEAIRFLELARDDWYQRCGLWGGRPWSSDEILGTIVVNVNVNYRLECFLGEELIVITIPVSMGAKSYTLGHEIIRPDASVAIDGHATSVVMDMSERRVIPVPACLAEHLPAREL